MTQPKKRDFEIEKICITRPREVLYDRINRRVLKMIDAGLVEEARNLLPYRDLPALQTVGYKGSDTADPAEHQTLRQETAYMVETISRCKVDGIITRKHYANYNFHKNNHNNHDLRNSFSSNGFMYFPKGKCRRGFRRTIHCRCQ